MKPNRHTLSGNVGCAAVNRLYKTKLIANIRGRGDSQAANEGCGCVTKNISVEIRSDHNVVVLRVENQLIDHTVDELLLHLTDLS